MNAMTMTATTSVGRPPQVGQKAPDFTLITSAGETFQLSQALQKGPVVLAFLPGAFTGVCTSEMCTFTKDWNEFAKWNAQVVGVTVDSKHSLNAWAKKENIQTPLVSDFEKKTVAAYGLVWNSSWGATSKRSVFVVDRAGVVRYQWVSEDATKEPNYAEVKKALETIQ